MSGEPVEDAEGVTRGIYLAGPVEKDDDPRSWRDEIKSRFPAVDFIDPMDFQEDWEEDPVGVIERELEVCESHPILVCNIGSEAPETIGTHHEISHALAHGNDRIAVVPDGEVAGFIEHRVTTYDSAEMAVSALVDGPAADEEKELVTDGGVEDADTVPRQKEDLKTQLEMATNLFSASTPNAHAEGIHACINTYSRHIEEELQNAGPVDGPAFASWLEAMTHNPGDFPEPWGAAYLDLIDGLLLQAVRKDNASPSEVADAFSEFAEETTQQICRHHGVEEGFFNA